MCSCTTTSRPCYSCLKRHCEALEASLKVLTARRDEQDEKESDRSDYIDSLLRSIKRLREEVEDLQSSVEAERTYSRWVIDTATMQARAIEVLKSENAEAPDLYADRDTLRSMNNNQRETIITLRHERNELRERVDDQHAEIVSLSEGEAEAIAERDEAEGLLGVTHTSDSSTYGWRGLRRYIERQQEEGR